MSIASDETLVPNVSTESSAVCAVSAVSTGATIGSALGDYCFVCKVFFDRNLKKSRRRILRDRDDLVSPLMLLLWTAQRTGTWFSVHDMLLNTGPLDQTVTQRLQQMFACRKCFESVIRLERELKTFETEISLMLDQSCDTLLEFDIIRGDPQTVRQLQTEVNQKSDNKKKRKIRKTKKNIKVLQKKKKSVNNESNESIECQPQPQPQQLIQKTKQILLLTKGQEGEGQQLLVLQVPDNDDNENEETESSTHGLNAYNPSLDHRYHNDESQAVFLSSNAIPVTTCVTVTSDDQVLEVQLEHNQEEQEEDQQHMRVMDEYSEDQEVTELEDVRASDEEQEYEEHRNDIDMKGEDEASDAINTIPAEEKDWNEYNETAIVESYKRKGISSEESEELIAFKSREDEDNELLVKKKSKKAKESYIKRTYSPRSSSPLPPAGESKVVVQLLYGSKQWKRTMDGEIKSIIRDMALRRPEPAGRKIAASDKLCSAVMKNYSKRLVTECKEAARTIRVADHQDVTQLDMKTFTAEVFQKCPKTANLVKSLIPIDPRDTLDEHGATALIMGVILYMHSMQSNTLQHILSYVLRRAGCNREGFKTLHSLGLTLSYTSILKIMNDIDSKPDVAHNSSLDTIEKSIDSVVVRTKNEYKNESKKKCAQVVAQEPQQEGDPVLLQFTLPYYQSTTFTTGRTPSLTYTTSTGQTTYTAVPYEPTESSNAYSQ